MEWDEEFIKVWHFSRSKVPRDISEKKPHPKRWGRPHAVFGGSSCDVDTFFRDMKLVINIVSHHIPCDRRTAVANLNERTSAVTGRCRLGQRGPLRCLCTTCPRICRQQPPGILQRVLGCKVYRSVSEVTARSPDSRRTCGARGSETHDGRRRTCRRRGKPRLLRVQRRIQVIQ